MQAACYGSQDNFQSAKILRKLRKMSVNRIIVLLAGSALVVTAFIPPAPQTIGAGEIIYAMLIAVMLLVFVMKLMVGPCNLQKTYLYVPLGAFAFLVILSIWPSFIINNVSPYLWLRGITPFLIYTVIPPLVYATRTSTDLRILISSLLLSAFVIALNSIRSITGAEGYWRALLPVHAFQPHPIAAFAFLMGYATEVKGLRKIGVWIAAFFLLVVIMVTESRSFIILAVVAAIFGTLRGGPVLAKLVRLGMVAIAIALLIALLQRGGENIDVFRRFAKGIIDPTRVEETKAVLIEFAKSPIFGNGFGYQYTYERTSIHLVWEGQYTHNLVTYILLTTGLVGITVLLLAGVALGREVLLSLKIIHHSVSQEAKALFWGSLYALTATLGYALFQSVFRSLGFPLIVSFCIVAVLKVRVHDMWQTCRRRCRS
jgi:hypothetical protein